MRRFELPLLTLILLGGAALRLIDLVNLGLEHDEVANWLIDRSILAGNHAIYFQEAYGHEAGFHYLQALFVGLLGDNALALRLPAALLGVLLLACSYLLVRRLYDSFTALIATTITAITFFPVFYSRLALRAMLLPVVAALAAAVFWRALCSERSRGAWRFAAAGALAGLSLHSYMAARVVPIFFLAFFALLAIVRTELFVRRRRGLLLFVAAYLIVALPLLIYLWANPAAEFRIGEINYPLTQLRQGNLRPVLENSRRILGVWGWSGDPLWRQNVAGQPIFEPVTALLFYAGVLLLLVRRRLADWFVLLWLATATIPSVVTVDAPSTIRMINMLPLLGVPIAQLIHKGTQLSTQYTGLSTKALRISWITGLTILIIWGSARTIRYTQHVWPQGGDCLVGDCVPFVWQTALSSAATYLDQAQQMPTSIVGWSPTTMDAPTMQLHMRNDDLPLRFSAPDSVVLPFGSGRHVRIVQPRTPLLPLPQTIENVLDEWQTGRQQFEHFAVYELAAPAQISAPPRAVFGDELALLSISDCTPVDGGCELVTLWRVEQPVDQPRAVFVHALDAAGEIAGQSDGLDVPTAVWQTGDLILRRHWLPADAAALRIGVYNPVDGQRLQREDGSDSYLLADRQ